MKTPCSKQNSYIPDNFMTIQTTTIESPCILVCAIDMKSGYCFGCGRTKEEIGDWLTMAPPERRSIMQLLPARLETLEHKPRRQTRRQRIASGKNAL
jgi:uncharacterized protein